MTKNDTDDAPVVVTNLVDVGHAGHDLSEEHPALRPGPLEIAPPYLCILPTYLL